MTLSAPQSFVDVVRERAERLGERRVFTFLADGEEPAEEIGFAGLDARARRVGAELQRSGAAGERVLLLLPPGLDFIASFLGCLYAGAVAVPAYPPSPGRGTGRLRSLGFLAGGARIAGVAGIGGIRESDVDTLLALAFDGYFSSLSLLGRPDKGAASSAACARSASTRPPA